MSLAIVLLSGGLDSTVTAARAISDGHAIVALTVGYGQRHARELEAARAVAKALAAREHVELEVDLASLGGSALTDAAVELPMDRDEAAMGEGIPATYVPARNTVLLSLALALAEARDAEAIYIGANAVDYSGYPDCRPEFLESFERTANLATKRGVEGRPFRIIAPLVDLSKEDIVRLGVELGAPLELTWSCYVGGAAPCGRCDSCRLRAKGFAEAGIEDPALRRGVPLR